LTARSAPDRRSRGLKHGGRQVAPAIGERPTFEDNQTLFEGPPEHFTHCRDALGCGDLGEVQVHRLGVAGRHDQGCTLALLRADCTEDVGGSGPLVPRCAWTGAALGPAAGDLVLLADAGLVGEPDFYRVAVKRLLARNCLQARGEVFLKSSIAPSACAW